MQTTQPYDSSWGITEAGIRSVMGDDGLAHEEEAPSSDAMTTDDTIAWLSSHGIDTQLIGGRVQARDVWTKDGATYDEWVVVTCELGWLRNWMNY